MVKGLNTFRSYFADYEKQYVLIGGAACDIVFESNDTVFRATRDLDMVLIIEALTPEFCEKFWEFIRDGGYRNKATNGQKPQFYRFDKPEDEKVSDLPSTVKTDIEAFIDSLTHYPFDSNSLKNYGLKNEDLIEALQKIYN